MDHYTCHDGDYQIKEVIQILTSFPLPDWSDNGCIISCELTLFNIIVNYVNNFYNSNKFTLREDVSVCIIILNIMIGKSEMEERATGGMVWDFSLLKSKRC